MFNYCPYCGIKLTIKSIGDEGYMKYCEPCEKPMVDMFYIATITMVINELNEICLLKQNYISKAYFVFVSGYLKKDEHVETSIGREVFEETGQVVQNVSYHLSSYDEKKNTLRLGFVAFVNKTHLIRSIHEVDDINWYTIEEAKKYLNPLGFTMKIYQSYIDKMRLKQV